MNEKALCLNCGDYVDFKIDNKDEKTKFKGIEINYTRLTAKCKICGEEVYVAEIDKKNLDSIRFEYCKTVGIATEKDIEKILKKYHISLETLAHLLNCSVPTIKRYYHGAIIKNIYSERLLNILQDTQYCKELLLSSQNVKSRAKNKALKIIDSLNELNIVGQTHVIEENSITQKLDNNLSYASFNINFNNMCLAA